jgi:hypothetical protein
MRMHLSKFFESKTGKVMFSIILGFGLSTLFRAACKGKNCVIHKAPPLEEVDGKIFKHGDKCYQYTSTATKCDASKQIIDT